MQNAPRALAIITCVTFALCGGAWAQESTDQASKLAKAAQNPLAAMTTLPLQFNWNTGAGEYDRTAFNLNVQPVIPFQGKKWNVIARAIMPIVSEPQYAIPRHPLQPSSADPAGRAGSRRGSELMKRDLETAFGQQ